jgi:hypothetical protein
LRAVEVRGGRRIARRRSQESARKIRLEDPSGLSPGIAVVDFAGRRQRRAVDRFRQLGFDDVGPAGIHRKTGKDQQAGRDCGHVYDGESFLSGCLEAL